MRQVAHNTGIRVVSRSAPSGGVAWAQPRWAAPTSAPRGARVALGAFMRSAQKLAEQGVFELEGAAPFAELNSLFVRS